MGIVVTDRAVDLGQLTEELGGKGLRASQEGKGPTVIECADATDDELRAAVAAHVPDPDRNKPPESLELEKLRQAAEQVLAGKDRFSDDQLQKIAASLILKAAR